MTNTLYMAPAFEREKNLKASVYTSIVCGTLLIIFFFAQWTLPDIPPPALEEGIEVNLGNSETGLGEEAPLIPTEASAKQESNFTPPPAAQPEAQDKPNITADENETEDVPAIKKVEKTVAKTKPVDEAASKPINKTVAATVPTPKPPSPKALYKGGTNTDGGGNNADTYNKTRNQGIAGGQGDQGSPGGNPNSDSYKGNPGNHGGVKIRSGLDGRRFTRLPSFQDDFNENAKVAVDIKVDRNGNVTSAVVNPRGTTTTNAGIKAIAVRKALQLKLNAGTTDEQMGTLIFDFKLNG